MAAIAASDAPVHVIHALAGCGKSAVLQYIVALFAARHSALPDAEAGSQMLLLVATTRTLRLLQTLLRNQVLKPAQVLVAGGRLPSRFLEAGVLDDDAAHLQKIVMKMQGLNNHRRD
jgi:hypothetical protein